MAHSASEMEVPRSGRLLFFMVLALALTGSVALWDAGRESEMAMRDFGQQQVSLARAVGAALRAKWAAEPSPPRDAEAILSWLARGLAPTEQPGRLMVLIDSSHGLMSPGGRRHDLPTLRAAMAAGDESVRLRRDEVQRAQLALPFRLAVGGIGQVALGDGGTWTYVVIATAENLRDREQRAEWRLGLSMAVATGLVLFFGGWAMRVQRRQLLLSHHLDLARLEGLADERLAQANKAATLGTLAIGIAHEISTPLAVIGIRAEQLASGADRLAGARVHESADVILEQTDRIGQTIRALLGLVRGEVPVTGNVAPAAIVKGAVSLVEHRFAQRNVELDVAREAIASLPAVGGDERLLEQALVNLLLNACDASPSGSRVLVRGTREGRLVELSVLDEGAGFFPAADAEATRPFLAPTASTKPPGEGTGLGLALTREILASHRGELQLVARAPRGTIARMRIPLAATLEET